LRREPPRERLRGVDLKALILNCALKRLPEPSNTQALIDIVPGWQPEECGGARRSDAGRARGMRPQIGAFLRAARAISVHSWPRSQIAAHAGDHRSRP